MLINGLALLVAVRVVRGLHVDSVWAGLLAGAVLALVNTYIRPIVMFLSFPVTILTLGLFVLVINALMLALVTWVVPGFRVDGVGPALVGSLVLSLVAWILGWFFPV